MASVNVASPFRISLDDEVLLERNDAFAAVRDHLRRQELGMNAPRYVDTQQCLTSCPSPARILS